MKRPMFAAFAMGFGLLASIAGAQTASAMVAVPAVAAADATAVQGSSATKVQWRRRRGYRRRPGNGWVPFAFGAIAGAAIARSYYHGPGPYYYGPGPYYYGPGPYYYGPGPYYYGPGPYYYGPGPYYYGPGY
jgi:hypothetical protein